MSDSQAGRALRWLLGNVVVMLTTRSVCDRNYNSQMPPRHLSLPANQRFWRPWLTGSVHLVSVVGLVVTRSVKKNFFFPLGNSGADAIWDCFLSVVACRERNSAGAQHLWLGD